MTDGARRCERCERTVSQEAKVLPDSAFVNGWAQVCTNCSQEKREVEKSVKRSEREQRAFACSACGADDFSNYNAMWAHKKKCDGVRRTAEERRSRQKTRIAEPRMALPMKPAAAAKPKPRDDDWGDDEDFDADDDVAGLDDEPTAAPPPPARSPAADSKAAYWVPCIQCGEKFPDARSLGIHQTRAHFDSSAAMSRRAGA